MQPCPVTLRKLMTPGLHFDGGWKFLIEFKAEVFAFDVRKGGLFSNILMPTRTACGAYIIVNNVTGAAYVGSSGNMYERARQHRRKLEKFEHPNKYLAQSYFPEYKHHFDVLMFFCTNRPAAYALEQWLVDELIHRDTLCNINQDVQRSKKDRVVPEFHKPEHLQKHYLQLSQPDCQLGIQGGFHDTL